MDVSEIRKQILRALDNARKDAEARRQATDQVKGEYETFLNDVAVPLFRQAASVLRALGHEFSANTPAGSVRLESASAQEYLELELDASAGRVQVIGRTGLMRGRGGPLVEERTLAVGKSVSELGDADVAALTTGQRLKLVARATGHGRDVRASVRLETLDATDPLGSLDGQSNALELDTWPLGRLVITQRDGGLEQTAYALFSDLVTVARRSRQGARIP